MDTDSKIEYIRTTRPDLLKPIEDDERESKSRAIEEHHENLYDIARIKERAVQDVYSIALADPSDKYKPYRYKCYRLKNKTGIKIVNFFGVFWYLGYLVDYKGGFAHYFSPVLVDIMDMLPDTPHFICLTQSSDDPELLFNQLEVVNPSHPIDV